MNDISYYLALPYTRVLRRDEDGDIVATIAELDGCIADGADDAEALRNLLDAQTAWLEHAIAAGQDPPVPEIEEDLPSGKFVVRLPRSLHRRLNKLAKQDDVSLNQIMVMAATEHVAKREVRGEIAATAHGADGWYGPSRTNWKRQAVAPARTDYLKVLRDRKVVAAQEMEQHRHVSRRSRAQRG